MYGRFDTAQKVNPFWGCQSIKQKSSYIHMYTTSLKTMLNYYSLLFVSYRDRNYLIDKDGMILFWELLNAGKPQKVDYQLNLQPPKISVSE